MDKINIERIYIVGLGALGALYASKLHRILPASVKIIADQRRIDTFKQAGIQVNGEHYKFDFITPTAIQPPADLIIIVVKYAQLQQAIEAIKDFIGEKTVVISLLNGISSEGIIGDVIGHQHMLFAYGVGMDAVRDGTNISYTNPGKIVFGEANNNNLSDRVVALKNLFESAGIPYQIPVDMERALWSKFMINTSINPVSAILKAPYAVFQQSENAQQLMLIAATEVIALSNCCGIHLNRTDFDEFIGILKTLNPVGKTSMLQDVEAGRRTEIDLFSGTVIELGKKYHVATPVNEMLFRMIKAMEEM